MTVRKVWRMWSSGVGEAMKSTPGRVVQVIVVVLALAGFAVLFVRRRFLEAVVFAVPIATITAIGAVTLASSRRSEVLMTLVFPLAAAAVTAGVAYGRERAAARDAPAPALAQRRPGVAAGAGAAAARLSSTRRAAPRGIAMTYASLFPSELTALRSAGLIVGGRDRRLRADPPPVAAQRRRPDPARWRRSGWRSSPAPS